MEKKDNICSQRLSTYDACLHLILGRDYSVKLYFYYCGGFCRSYSSDIQHPKCYTPSTSVSSDSRREIEVRFRDIPDRNIIDICDETFKEIREIFEEASQRFGT